MPSLIGNKPNQVPTNGDLGTLAFQDASNPKVGTVIADGLTVDTTTLVVDSVNDRVGIGTSSPNFKLENTTAADIGNNAIYSTTVYAFGRSATPCYITAYRESFSTNSSIVFHSNNNEGTAPSEKMRLTSSGNLGLGVTPSAWGSAYRAFDLYGAGLASSTTGGQTIFAQNAYNNGTNYIYKYTAPATFYHQLLGEHRWNTAPSGTAGNAITFTQAMTLDASGRLGIGTTSPSTRLHVASATNTTSGQIGGTVHVRDTTSASGVEGMSGIAFTSSLYPPPLVRPTSKLPELSTI